MARQQVIPNVVCNWNNVRRGGRPLEKSKQPSMLLARLSPGVRCQGFNAVRRTSKRPSRTTDTPDALFLWRNPNAGAIPASTNLARRNKGALQTRFGERLPKAGT
jgi:hypothetical protein